MPQEIPITSIKRNFGAKETIFVKTITNNLVSFKGSSHEIHKLKQIAYALGATHVGSKNQLEPIFPDHNFSSAIQYNL